MTLYTVLFLSYFSPCSFLFFYLCWSPSKSCFPNVCASVQSLALFEYTLCPHCCKCHQNVHDSKNLPQALVFLQAHFFFKSHLLVSPKLDTSWNKLTLLLFFVWSNFSFDWIISVNKLFSPLHSWWSLWIINFFLCQPSAPSHLSSSVCSSFPISLSFSMPFTSHCHHHTLLFHTLFTVLVLLPLVFISSKPLKQKSRLIFLTCHSHCVIKCLNLLSLYWNPNSLSWHLIFLIF